MLWKRILDKCGVNQYYVAKIINLPRSYIHNRFVGKAKPAIPYEVLLAIIALITFNFFKKKGITNYAKLTQQEKQTLQKTISILYKEFLRKKLPDVWQQYETSGRPSYYKTGLSTSNFKQLLSELHKSMQSLSR